MAAQKLQGAQMTEGQMGELSVSNMLCWVVLLTERLNCDTPSCYEHQQQNRLDPVRSHELHLKKKPTYP